MIVHYQQDVSAGREVAGFGRLQVAAHELSAAMSPAWSRTHVAPDSNGAWRSNRFSRQQFTVISQARTSQRISTGDQRGGCAYLVIASVNKSNRVDSRSHAPESFRLSAAIDAPIHIITGEMGRGHLAWSRDAEGKPAAWQPIQKTHRGRRVNGFQTTGTVAAAIAASNLLSNHLLSQSGSFRITTGFSYSFVLLGERTKKK